MFSLPEFFSMLRNSLEIFRVPRHAALDRLDSKQYEALQLAHFYLFLFLNVLVVVLVLLGIVVFGT